MNDTYPRLDLRYVISVLRRRGIWILGSVAVVFVLVYVLSSLQTNVYTANSEVQIQLPPTAVLTENNRGSAQTVSLGNEVYRITSATVRAGVREAVGPEQFDDTVKGVGVARITDTDVLRISVRSTSPETAQEAADAYATTYVSIRSDELQRLSSQQADELRAQSDDLADRIREIDAELAEIPEGSDAEVLRLERSQLIDERGDLNTTALQLEQDAAAAAASIIVTKQAGLPRLPDSPTPLRDAGVAALVTLVVGLGIAFLMDQLDTRIKTPAQITEATGGLPLLGAIPALRRRRRFLRDPEVPREVVQPGSSSAEAFRALATSLRFSGLRKEKRRILITSCLSGEGKTTLTANLAAVLAENGLRVLVVSADLRRPQLGGMLGVSDTDKGLTSVVLGDDELVDVLASVSRSGEEAITLLPSGPLPHDPSVLLGSDELGDMLDQFEQAGADFILIDCAPVLPVSDPLAVARHVDGVILVTKFAKTRRTELRSAVDRLEKVDAEIIGVVLNDVVQSSEYGYVGTYGYGPADA